MKKSRLLGTVWISLAMVSINVSAAAVAYDESTSGDLWDGDLDWYGTETRVGLTDIGTLGIGINTVSGTTSEVINQDPWAQHVDVDFDGFDFTIAAGQQVSSFTIDYKVSAPAETSIDTSFTIQKQVGRDTFVNLARFTIGSFLSNPFDIYQVVSRINRLKAGNYRMFNNMMEITAGPSKVESYYSIDYTWNIGVTTAPDPTTHIDLIGTIKTTNRRDICAMVLVSGQFMFSCNPTGVFSLFDLPLEKNGTAKRQIYADGFFPMVDILTGTADDAVVMTRSGDCPRYTSYDPGFFPDFSGKRINISGKVLIQDSKTPICAMVLANGKHMFSCDGTGSYALNIPLDTNGQFKLQAYADGFAPTIQTFDKSRNRNDVRMARAVECK